MEFVVVLVQKIRNVLCALASESYSPNKSDNKEKKISNQNRQYLSKSALRACATFNLRVVPFCTDPCAS